MVIFYIMKKKSLYMIIGKHIACLPGFLRRQNVSKIPVAQILS